MTSASYYDPAEKGGQKYQNSLLMMHPISGKTLSERLDAAINSGKLQCRAGSGRVQGEED